MFGGLDTLPQRVLKKPSQNADVDYEVGQPTGRDECKPHRPQQYRGRETRVIG